jgi:hypothetical protein
MSEERTVRDQTDDDFVVERCEDAPSGALLDTAHLPDVRMKILDQMIQEYVKARRGAGKTAAPPPDASAATPVTPAPPPPTATPCKKMGGVGVRKRVVPLSIKYKVPAKGKFWKRTASAQHIKPLHGSGMRAKTKSAKYRKPQEEGSTMRFLLYR